MRKLVTWFLMAAMVITSVEVNLNTVLADDNAYQSIDYENSTISDDIQPKTEDVSEECKEENDSIEQENDELKNETNGMLEGQDPTIEEQNPEIDDCANSWRYQNGEEVQQRNQREVAEQSLYITQPNISRRGIDVSEHNGNINWDKVKADGVEFAIIRCGYGQNSSSQDDKKWLRNVSECERLGIPYGVYIYSYATNVSRASSEADHVLRLINGHNLSYPVYFDMEDKSTENSDLTAIAKTFCNKIKNSGYAVGVYASLSWWNTKLTDSCFSGWHRWIASWSASKCNYNGEFALWQYSDKGAVSGISGYVDMNYLIGSPADHGEKYGKPISEEVKNAITYETHVSDVGWQGSVQGGMTAGTVGQNHGIEALKITSNVANLGVKYTSYTKAERWQQYVFDGNITGSEGNARALEAIKMELTGTEKDNYDIYYRVHVSDFGWLDWTKNGAEAGTIGYGKKIEAVQIRLLKKDSEYIPQTGANSNKIKSFGVGYQAHVQNVGWQNQVENGAISGTTGMGRQIEAVKMQLQNQDVDGSIEYKVHVADIGWQDFKSEGEMAGTTGSNKQIEAIAIRLTGEMAEKYDVYYRVHSADFGWMGWTKNGENAGSEGYGKRIEAYQIQLIEKGKAAPGDMKNAFKKKHYRISYRAHVADVGWQNYVSEDEVAGTVGAAKQIEALKIKLDNKKYPGSIEYRVHVADIGWQKYVSENDLAGTTGKNKQIEAISVKLTGKMAEKYDIYYRVHSADFGWLGWAMNGKNAGTQGYGKRIEAIQIELLDKGETFSGGIQNSFYVR